MRVLAASFPDQASANAARDRLIVRFTLNATEIGVESLATGGRRRDTAILAGRFEDEVVVAAIDVVVHFGGTIVVDTDEHTDNA